MNGEVLLNLLTSAIEAMVAGEGTRILGVKFGLSEDGGIAISVSDTGQSKKSQEIDQI